MQGPGAGAAGAGAGTAPDLEAALEYVGWEPKAYGEGDEDPLAAYAAAEASAEASAQPQQAAQQAQQQAAAAAEAEGAGPPGFIFDPTTGYLKDPVSGYFFDANSREGWAAAAAAAGARPWSCSGLLPA